MPGDAGYFNFNQYLIADDAPMLFHTGMRQMFPLVKEAIVSVLPIERLRYIGLSHFESDECGSLNALLAAAPQTTAILEKLAPERPTTLACMHGSAWRGDGVRLLRELSVKLSTPTA